MPTRIVWTSEALDDLESILSYYHEQAGPATAEAVQGRIVSQIEALRAFPERIRDSDRIPGARELVISRLPYIAFIQALPDGILVLNVIHTARRFPA